MLKLNSIVKDYISGNNKVRAVDGITLEFRKSEFVAILGASGCGKTTTMNIVGGLDKYTTGDLVIDGHSTKSFKDKDWDNYRNKRVGFVFQSYNLIPHLTVLSNVEIALTISGVSIAERRKRAKQALQSVGLLDQIHKRPNQLSGGQMQRVAIARAIVNQPEILLADEPTGALDTKTSEQIMQLIQEIAKDRLVIMVTHNPELAQNYATRIISMQDGKIVSDSNPYDSSIQLGTEQNQVQLQIEQATEPVKGLKKQKTAMSFFTALSLSMRNLLTKKKRSILTSIACAIGIIGIGLIMAITNGVNTYIGDVSREQVESLPINVVNGTHYLEDNTRDIGVDNDTRGQIAIRMSQEIIEYIADNSNPNWFNNLFFNTGMSLKFFIDQTTDGSGDYLSFDANAPTAMGDFGALLGLGSAFQMIPQLDLISRQFELLEGSYPKNSNELLLIVDTPYESADEPIEIGNSVLSSIGLERFVDRDTISSQEIFDIEYKVTSNQNLFSFNSVDNKFSQNWDTLNTKPNSQLKDILDNGDFENDQVVTLKFSGVARAKYSKDPKVTVLNSGVAFTEQLFLDLQQLNLESEIAKWMRLPQNNGSQSDSLGAIFNNPMTGARYTDQPAVNSGIINSPMYTASYQWDEDLHTFGGATTPWTINAYVRDIESKNAFVNLIKDYNSSRPFVDKIYYSDILETMASVVLDTVNIVSTVLIGFTAVSLVVSAVMISIITSISVLERTKEIGILRSIGARKKDVVRLFNAENFILGLFSGLIGVVFTLLLSFIVSTVLSTTLGVTGIATVTIISVVILLAISTLTSLLAGFLPSRAAAKKDPVLALRTE